MEDNMPDIEQIGRIVQTARMLGGLMQGGNEPRQERQEAPEESRELPAEEREALTFDDELQSPAIRSIKAAIPYLDCKYQKNMGIAVKLMELDRLINHYTVIAAQSGSDNGKAMLTAVKNELPEQMKPAADLLMKIMEIREIALTWKGAEAN